MIRLQNRHPIIGFMVINRGFRFNIGLLRVSSHIGSVNLNSPTTSRIVPEKATETLPGSGRHRYGDGHLKLQANVAK